MYDKLFLKNNFNNDCMINDNLSKKFEEVTGLNFQEFYSTYKPKLIWYLTKYTKDQEISADFADDAFVQALLKIENYNAEKSQIHTWVYKIAENLVKKDHKDKQRMNVVSMDKQNDDNLNLSGIISNNLVDDDERHENELILSKKVQLVREAIYSLPEKYKNVMILREIENKAYLDIAELCKKEVHIHLNNDIKYLEDVTEFLSLELENRSDETNYINIKYIDNNEEEQTIQYDVKPFRMFKLERDEICDISEIEIISFGKMRGLYKTTTNLSTIKSQILKGRQLIQSMVKKKFKHIDEHGIY